MAPPCLFCIERGNLVFILQIVLVLFATKIAGQLSARLGQPSVLGKIIVGIILGPALLGWIHDTELLTILF